MIDPSSSEEESDEDHGHKTHMPYHPPHHHPPKSHGGIAHHGPASGTASGISNIIGGGGGANIGLDRGASNTIGSSHLISGQSAQGHYNSVSSDYGSAASSTHGTPQHMSQQLNVHKTAPGFGLTGSNAYTAPGSISASGSPKDMYHYQQSGGSTSGDGSMLNVETSNKNLARFV